MSNKPKFNPRRNKLNTPVERGDFADQLGAATGRVREASRFASPVVPANFNRNNLKFEFANHLPPCASWEGEGKDHINMDRSSRTQVGQALNMAAHLRFVHDLFGQTDSISRLWTLIDEIVGDNAITIKRVQLIAQLADAFWQKVQQYPLLAEELKSVSVPLDCYRWSEGGIPMRNTVSYWWVEIVNKVRVALVAGLPYPDFDNLQVGPARPMEDVKEDFLKEFIPNRRENAKVEEKKEGPTLIQALRETPPLKFGRGRKSSLGLKVERKSEPVMGEAASSVQEGVLEGTAIPEGTDLSNATISPIEGAQVPEDRRGSLILSIDPASGPDETGGLPVEAQVIDPDTKEPALVEDLVANPGLKVTGAHESQGVVAEADVPDAGGVVEDLEPDAAGDERFALAASEDKAEPDTQVLQLVDVLEAATIAQVEERLASVTNSEDAASAAADVKIFISNDTKIVSALAEAILSGEEAALGMTFEAPGFTFTVEVNKETTEVTFEPWTESVSA